MTPPARDPELPAGLYEALVTEDLRQRLARLRDAAITGQIPKADVPALFAAHLAAVATSVFGSHGFAEDQRAQALLLNKLITVLDASIPGHEVVDQRIVIPAEQLTEVRLASGRLPSEAATPRPLVPLSQNALLVAAKGEPQLAAALAAELGSADRVDILCAFVRWNGIRILRDQLRSLSERRVPIRVLTTTYTGSTERRALDWLVDQGARVKVSYDTGTTRLHAKAWLLDRASGFSTAYIGSSNLSHSALHDGLEWNVRLSQAVEPAMVERFRAAFETYWADPSFETYDSERFDEAMRREERKEPERAFAFEVRPYWYQTEMLYELDVERKRHGRDRNLVVAATGTGKTVLAAFDYERLRRELGPLSLLFVAHRREILEQSRSVFRAVLREPSFGELYVGGERPAEGRHVFASVQSLQHVDLRAVSPTAYDVVIVDEFHHAAAPTYERLLEHVAPKILLGLTATPERADERDILRWFDGRIAVELRLWDALEQGLLCPFQYFGIFDDVDLSIVRWHRGSYDQSELEDVLTGDDARVRVVLDAVQDVVEDADSMRALGFCVGVGHAEFMARKFLEAGYPSAAITGATPLAERDAILGRFRRGELRALFTVDVFNEGLDVPEIDTVLFLRPTESPVVFLQQLGRGLRRAEAKSGLTVIDFVRRPNENFSYEARFAALLATSRRRVVDAMQAGFPYLPAGCSIKLDRQSQDIILANLKRRVRARSAELADALRPLGDVSLAEFLEASRYDLDDVYGPGWSGVRRTAGFRVERDPDEPQLTRAIGRMLHIDDPERVGRYVAWLEAPSPPDPSSLSVRETRLVEMLHLDLWGGEKVHTTLSDSLSRLWGNAEMRRQLADVLALLGAQATRIAMPSTVDEDVPLAVHATYSRYEIEAAIGEAGTGRFPSWREGVKWSPTHNADFFTVTLNKSAGRFSPSTRYRDYPISPELFHWESQSTTSLTSKTGQRYLHHQEQGTRIFLFVRQEDIGPFVFLGEATYERHQGERPIAIVWRLTHPMPPDLFLAAKAAV